MFAVIESLGRQYKVSEGDVIKVDHIQEAGSEVEPGTELVFTQVLMLGGSEAESKVGAPYINGASVKAELVENGKEKKLISYKKKRRKGYERKLGFRRQYSAVKIKAIKAA